MPWIRLPLSRPSAAGRGVAPAPPPPSRRDAARHAAALRRRLVHEPGLAGADALAITRQLLELQREAAGEP